jgi:hypothetical protein
MPYQLEKYYMWIEKAPQWREVLTGETLAVFPDLVHEEVV